MYTDEWQEVTPSNLAPCLFFSNHTYIKFCVINPQVMASYPVSSAYRKNSMQ